MRRQTFGLEKDLVAGFAGEAVNLVLDRRTVPWPDALDDAREHRRAVERRADDVVSALVRVRDPTGQLLWMHAALAEERKHRLRRITRLHLHHAKVDATAIDTRWRAGLQPPNGQLELAQPCGKGRRRRLAGTTSGVALETDMDQPGEECPGGQHDRARPEFDAELRAHADDLRALDQDVVDGLLEQQQVGLALEPLADCLAIEHPIRLRARRAHGLAFGSVQNAELDTGLIGGEGHSAAEGIHLFDQVTLADAADRWIA